ncbi:peptidylprolyl isomerase [Flavobacterium sp. 5]|uniref:peptidylprolyl isomerase n=1 Tax=Flavobacterium sp. 5 TaxID=2035199 RepID=UPI000C2BD7F4|nr:peptidylprolyl isomerase [Flavobacterium sp. 5]PKB15625.1 cyclophilin family peptidyl-prolyl cis-trans isomerase [Flavobacterium sp. 5]
MKSKILLLLFLGVFNLHAQNTKKAVTTKKPATTAAKPAVSVEGIFATIATNKGNITVQLFFQKTPVTVANFISLAEGNNPFVTVERLKGKPFFDGLKFHRVIKDFMIQGGDPDGNGSGGPGYAFKDEFNDSKFDKAGILAMANSGPTTNGSQFFITHKDTPWLTGKHTIFGQVTQGMGVVNSIAQDDVITKITITRKGDLAKKFDAVKVFSNYFNNKSEDQKKQAAIDAENKKKQVAVDAETKRIYLEKYGPVINAKTAYFAAEKSKSTTTPSGLAYTVVTKGTGVKPVNGSTFYFHYAGYFEDGTLFDSSYEEVSKAYGKFDANRAAQNGYKPFPFEAGRKDGLIPGFLEGVAVMSYGEKVILFIPSNLAYGERGAGGVIPPNASLIFELEMFEKQQ